MKGTTLESRWKMTSRGGFHRAPIGASRGPDPIVSRFVKPFLSKGGRAGRPTERHTSGGILLSGPRQTLSYSP